MSDSGSESSPEESGSNTPSMPESGTATPSTMGTGSKKFDFLLQQTELFSHFMGTSQKVKFFVLIHVRLDITVKFLGTALNINPDLRYMIKYLLG